MDCSKTPVIWDENNNLMNKDGQLIYSHLFDDLVTYFKTYVDIKKQEILQK
jgi:hypothetical protein